MEYASVTAYHIVPPLPLPAVDTAVNDLDLLLSRALGVDVDTIVVCLLIVVVSEYRKRCYAVVIRPFCYHICVFGKV